MYATNYRWLVTFRDLFSSSLRAHLKTELNRLQLHTIPSNISSAAGASDSNSRHYGAAYKCFFFDIWHLEEFPALWVNSILRRLATYFVITIFRSLWNIYVYAGRYKKASRSYRCIFLRWKNSHFCTNDQYYYRHGYMWGHRFLCRNIQQDRLQHVDKQWQTKINEVHKLTDKT